MRKKSTEELTNNFKRAVDLFDYEKIRIHMVTVNHKWYTLGGTPTISQMKEMSWNLFDAAKEAYVKEKKIDVTASSGGFEVSISRRGDIVLRFVLSQIDSLDF